MPPVLTSVVSDLFYQGELQSCISKSENKIYWEGLQQGLTFQEVEHYSNASESKEEIDKIEELVNQLTGCSYQIVQKDLLILMEQLDFHLQLILQLKLIVES